MTRCPGCQFRLALSAGAAYMWSDERTSAPLRLGPSCARRASRAGLCARIRGFDSAGRRRASRAASRGHWPNRRLARFAEPQGRLRRRRVGMRKASDHATSWSIDQPTVVPTRPANDLVDGKVARTISKSVAASSPPIEAETMFENRTRRLRFPAAGSRSERSRRGAAPTRGLQEARRGVPGLRLPVLATFRWERAGSIGRAPRRPIPESRSRPVRSCGGKGSGTAQTLEGARRKIPFATMGSGQFPTSAIGPPSPQFGHAADCENRLRTGCTVDPAQETIWLHDRPVARNEYDHPCPFRRERTVV